jgi:hypothetical protein
MKFYVAGPFREYSLCRSVIDKVSSHGHECAYDWTRTSAFSYDGRLIIPQPPSVSDEEQMQADIQGVLESEFMVLIPGKSPGHMIEFGMALTSPLMSRVFVLPPLVPVESIFFLHEKVRRVSYHEFHMLLKEGL